MEQGLVNKTEVIVVGAGPAGIACALTIARAGRKVVLIERGKFSGSKNVFGGAVYAKSMREIFPDFENNAPIERKIVDHKFAILGDKDSTVVSYKNTDEDAVSYSVIRGKFDRWMAEEARKEGVILVEETVVKELLTKDSAVIGVRTELEDYYSDIVVLADGVNSLLAKQIGLRKEIEPKDVALSVKEVYKLPKEKINDRFNLDDNEGCVCEIFGGAMLGMLGLGFLYTNKESITIGVGITLDEFKNHESKPYEILDKIKQHSFIAPLIKDGELLEYSAHLIPEGGYKKIPKLYSSGVMVVGDAASLVNNLHWEGTNLAMISGKIAGETALTALEKSDFSEDMLSNYSKNLKKSFVIKDLRTYRSLMDVMHRQKSSFLDYYLRKINSFFKMFTSVDGIPKQELYRNFIKSYFKERKFINICKDFCYLLRLLWEIIIYEYRG